METMTRSDTDMMAQDKAAVNKLNQLLLRMRTEFLPRRSSSFNLGTAVRDNNNNSGNSNTNMSNNNSRNSSNNNNNNNSDTIPRSKTCDSRMDKARSKTTKKERKRSLPILTTQIKQEVVAQLDGLLGHLETMGEDTLVRSPPPQPVSPPPLPEQQQQQQQQQSPNEPQYAKVNKQKAKAKTKQNREREKVVDKVQSSQSNTLTLRRPRPSNAQSGVQLQSEKTFIEESPYSQINDLHYATLRDSNTTGASLAASRGASVGSFQNEPYMLEDAASYLLNKFVFSRQVSVDSKYYSKNYCDLNLGVGSTIATEHSTLCRRLRSLEASVGITLKKQLHSFVKKKMNSMNVSGCIYCMYAFYEKHKREADEKAQEIRKTITEQEFIKQTLDAQKKQSDADSKWLENEERFSYVGESSPNGSTDDDENRYGWRENLHSGGSKSDSEQLGCTSAKDVKKKKLPPLRLRRSIPLWELLKKDRKTLPTTEECITPPPTSPPPKDPTAPAPAPAPTSPPPNDLTAAAPIAATTTTTTTLLTETTPPPTAATAPSLAMAPVSSQTATCTLDDLLEDVFTPVLVTPSEYLNVTNSTTDTTATKNDKSELLITETIVTMEESDERDNDNDNVNDVNNKDAAPNSEVANEVPTTKTTIQSDSNSTDDNEVSSDSVVVEEQHKVEENVGSTHVRTSLFSTSPDSNCIVYQHTANLVKSILHLNTGMQHAKAEEFVDLVNVVGFNLRDLLACVDDEVKDVSLELRKEVEMAHGVLSSDMADLVNKMKTAQKYADTMLDNQSRREMLQAAHVLAIDTKNFYDGYSGMIPFAENSNPS